MAGLEDAPEAVHRAILAGVAAYFVLIVIDAAIGNPLVAVAADVLFGFVAIGVGIVLLDQTDGAVSAGAVGGAALVAGGLAQLAWVVIGAPLLNAVATVGILAGIALYIYVVWTADS